MTSHHLVIDLKLNREFLLLFLQMIESTYEISRQTLSFHFKISTYPLCRFQPFPWLTKKPNLILWKDNLGIRSLINWLTRGKKIISRKENSKKLYLRFEKLVAKLGTLRDNAVHKILNLKLPKISGIYPTYIHCVDDTKWDILIWLDF